MAVNRKKRKGNRLFWKKNLWLRVRGGKRKIRKPYNLKGLFQKSNILKSICRKRLQCI